MPSSNQHRNSRGARPPNNHSMACTAGNSNAGPTKSSNIRVVVRIRPPNPAELNAGSGSRPIVQMLDEKLLVFDPKEDATPSYFHGRRIARRNFMQRKNKDIKFAFDHVFGERVSQQYVYENTTKAIVDSMLAGYNASVFAYGATGAGKTFTMLGAGPDCPGVIFLTVVDLYQRIGEIAKDKHCDVAVSYLEVYNENIRDLLAPSGLLALREDPAKGVVVSGLSLHKPRSAEELLHMLEFGNSKRTQHPTDANAQSSRSHAVFQVFVRQKDRTANISTNFRIAKMSLIDLAGSERATVTTNRGARFREGANINRSLLALGNCINALAGGNKSKGQHIPYRNSKLTRLLKDSLGGNCQTVMIAAISPSSLTYEDTLNTLKYANRAKNICTTLKQNVVQVDLHISRYAQIVEELRAEVFQLKMKLQSNEMGVGKLERSLPPPDDNEEGIHRLQLELHKVFVQRGSIRKELLELESSDRHLTVMISRKLVMAERIRLLYGKSAQGDKTMGRFERHIAASSARQARLRDRKPAVEERIKANQDWLEGVKTQMKTGQEDGLVAMVFQDSLRTRHLEIELKDCRRQMKHLKRFARQQDSHQHSSERLIMSLLSTVRKQYYLLKGSGLVTSDVTSDFEAIQKQVEGDREVAWADQSMSEVAEVKSGASAEVDLNFLLELPVMKCVETTPKAPSRSPWKTRGCKSRPHTPVKDQNITASHVSDQNQAPMTNRTLASRVPCSKVNSVQPPSRCQTPNRNTPRARRNYSECNTVNSSQPLREGRPHTPGAASNVCNTDNWRISNQEPATSPDGLQKHNKDVCNAGIGCNIPQCNSQTVTKERPSLRSTDPPGSSVQTSVENPKQNLASAFEMEGISPLLNSPSPAAESQANCAGTCIRPTPAAAQGSRVTETDHSRASSVAVTFREENSVSTNCNVQQNSHKPVARTISFDQENSFPHQKISPVTGRVISYAEALTTPQRAPFAVLTNNSPQLQTRASTKVLNALGEYPSKATGNQCSGSQPMSKSTKRNLQRRGTFTKHNAPLHCRSRSQGVLGDKPFSFQGTKHAETLRRFGLPSMSDQPTVGIRKPTPAYMTLTASAANKRRNHGRGLQSSQENQLPLVSRGPMRLHRTESVIKPAARIPSFSKSRSMSNLHGKLNP